METPKNHNDLAIIVIDMQKCFLHKINSNEKERLITAQQDVLRYAAEEDVPVAVLEYSLVGKPRRRRETIDPIASWIKKVPRHEYMWKDSNSGFKDTPLERQLRGWNKQTLLLTGVYGSACVYMTAMDGLDRDFVVLTDRKLISDGNVTMSEIAVARYEQKGCLLTNYRNFLGI